MNGSLIHYYIQWYFTFTEAFNPKTAKQFIFSTCNFVWRSYYFMQNEGYEPENLTDAKKRMHKLLDDAFALITPKLDEYVFKYFI